MTSKPDRDSKQRGADDTASKQRQLSSRERQIAPLREHAFKPGQSGNPAGRPKGSRNKLTTEFFEDLYAAWQKHGDEALERVAENSPKDLVKVTAMLMPREFELKSPLNELTDAELRDYLDAVRTLIASGAVGQLGDGGGASSKPH